MKEGDNFISLKMRDFITSASSFVGMPQMDKIDLESMSEEQRLIKKN